MIDTKKTEQLSLEISELRELLDSQRDATLQLDRKLSEAQAKEALPQAETEKSEHNLKKLLERLYALESSNAATKETVQKFAVISNANRIGRYRFGAILLVTAGIATSYFWNSNWTILQ